MPLIEVPVEALAGHDVVLPVTAQRVTRPAREPVRAAALQLQLDAARRAVKAGVVDGVGKRRARPSIDELPFVAGQPKAVALDAMKPDGLRAQMRAEPAADAESACHARSAGSPGVPRSPTIALNPGNC